MTSSREAEDHFGGARQATTTTTTATTTTSWLRLKDPRIVRVSRAMGGSKDRHSKVCTVRGLRDRRVRLSVPTAIQLYDLQERLGLNQPSKVVDWLLNAAKDEIDKLPPLQIPTSFAHMLTDNPLHHQQLLDKLKDVSGETSESRNDPSWMRSEELEVENRGNNNNNINNYAAANVNSSEMGASYNSFGRWDPSNLTLSSQHHQHQLLAYHQSGMITQPYFSPQINAAFEANVRPFHFNMTADLLPSQDQQSKRE